MNLSPFYNELYEPFINYNEPKRQVLIYCFSAT
jgi:hypothetical protein